jgi:hypothetical protein
MLIDTAIAAGRNITQKYHANGSRKETKTQRFMHGDATNVDRAMYVL